MLDGPLSDLEDLEARYGENRVLAMALQEAEDRELRHSFAAQGGLLRFVEHFWPVLEPDTVFLQGWALEAMAAHLEATVDDTYGIRITRLLENVCPGSMKSLLLVFFTAWLWGPKKMPGKRILCMSYSEDNPQRDNRKTINLINSAEYQRLYGSVFKLTKSGEQLIENNKTGFKQAVGIRGGVTGKRADFLLIDDPNNISDGESEPIRDETNRKFKEAVSNRLNDMTKSTIVVIQQRSHQDDVSGMILQEGWPYVHLCIPLLYEAGRHCETPIWEDPRTEDGENYWPERYPEDAVQLAMDMGEFSFAGQFQQRPEPRGGGILKRDYWQDWDPEPNPLTGKRDFPVCDFVVASLDPAYTTKEQNDPSGFGIWGCFQTKDGDRAAILIHAFSRRLELCGPEPQPKPGETYADWKGRTQDEWGLIETVNDLCRRFKVDVLLIENKASGITVTQAMEKLFLRRRYQVQSVDPRGLDKMARVNIVQPVFSGKYIYAPLSKDYAQSVINECATFPRGKHDDQVDQTTQAIYWLRSNGFLIRREEQFMSKEESMKKYKQPPPIYAI